MAIIDYIKLWKGEKERPLKTIYRPLKVEKKEEYFPLKTEKKPDVKYFRRAKSLNDISNIVEVDQDLKKEERKVIEIIETIEDSELLDVSEKDFEDEKLLEISNKTGKTDETMETDRNIETDEHSEINTSKESESLEEGEIASDDEVEKCSEKSIENSEENQETKKIEENRVEKSVKSESELPVGSERDIDKEIKTESKLKIEVKNDQFEIPKRSLSLSDIFSLARDWNFYEKYKPIKKEQEKLVLPYVSFFNQNESNSDKRKFVKIFTDYF